MSAVITEMTEPTKDKLYTVRLGESLLAEEGSTASGYSTVTCKTIPIKMPSTMYRPSLITNTTPTPDNHKPDLPAQSSTTTTIFPSGSAPGSYELKIEDRKNPTDVYHFEGRGNNASKLYALIYDSETDEYVLDRVDTKFFFKLTSTPSNPDANDLAAQYLHLEFISPIENESGNDNENEDENDNENENENAVLDDGDSDRDSDIDGDGPGGGEGEASAEAEAETIFEKAIDDYGPADPNNPYDWRHYIATSHTRGRFASPSPTPSASNEDEPLIPNPEGEADAPPPTSSSPPTTPTPSRPSRPKPKTKPKSKPKPKPRSRRLKTPPPPPKDEDADNEASDADTDADADVDVDDGVLTIEMDPETRPRRHLGAELARPASAAPISLRSAASSVSPRPHGREAGSGGEGESESEVESDEDADGVEVLPFSSSPPPPVAAADARAPTPGDAEDELEAELAQALELQEGVGGVAAAEVVGGSARRVESSSESEEE